VEPSTAQAPATLVFTFHTNNAVSAVQFRDNRHQALLIQSASTPSGDGLVWKCSVDFAESYQGILRVFLGGGTGQWMDSGESCQVNVQR